MRANKAVPVPRRGIKIMEFKCFECGMETDDAASLKTAVRSYEEVCVCQVCGSGKIAGFINS